MSLVFIRQASDDDLEAVLALYAQPEIDDGHVLSIEEARARFQRFRMYPDYRLYVACLDQKVVGTFTLLIVDNLAHRGVPSGLVEDVAVAVKHQGSGIGKQMMRFAFDRCREAGCYKMALSSSARRSAAHRFFESLGFVRHGYSFSTEIGKSGPDVLENGSEKERKMKRVTTSQKCLEIYPWMEFGYCFVNHLIPLGSMDHLRGKQWEVENYVRRNTESLMMKAKAISRFYKAQGEKNRSHIESLIRSISNGKSIKSVNFIVDSVMVAELRNAVLLGVHDVDRIEGDIILDVAIEGEKFMGIGNRSIMTRQNEVVLRDQIGIWASYTQGPDARTVVDAATRNIIILGFFTPETTREAISDCVELLLGVAKGESEEIRVIPS